MRIKKGDTVLILKGKDRGKQAKVLKGLPGQGRVLVEGVNIKKIHKRPRREGEKGQIVEVAAPLETSRVQLVCPQCHKATRVGYKRERGKKQRVCRKCSRHI